MSVSVSELCLPELDILIVVDPFAGGYLDIYPFAGDYLDIYPFAGVAAGVDRVAPAVLKEVKVERTILS